MTTTGFVYLIPYLISLIISTSVMLIIWQRRDVIGAKFYAVIAFGQVIITIGYIMELVSETLPSKIFWDDFQWIGFLIWAVAFPIFALVYTQSKHGTSPRTWILLSIIPILFLLLILTNNSHGLIRENSELVPGEPYSYLFYDFTIAVYLFAFYSYALMSWAFIILIMKYLRTHQIYRAQIGFIIFGASLPLIGTVLSLIGITLGPQRDIAPLTSAIGNIIIAWALTYLRLFDIAPLAREAVVDNMKDLVFVVDIQNRVLDVNPAALAIIDLEKKQIIGQLATDVFSSWIDEFVALAEIEVGEIELAIDRDIQKTYFNALVNTIKDKNARNLGRVYVARDITKQKDMERELRFLHLDLEKRVQERTNELATAYDSTLEGWANALELIDKETEGHSRRVTELTIQLARVLGIEDEEIVHIRRGALIHDIGKMGISHEILNKTGSLTNEERKEIEKHPIIAYNLLKKIPFLQKTLEIPFYHHERWDGTGYPRKLIAEEIPLSARMFTIIDNWDALLSDRPYRDAWPREKVINYLQEQSGAIFDPTLIRVFLKMIENETNID